MLNKINSKINTKGFTKGVTIKGRKIQA